MYHLIDERTERLKDSPQSQQLATEIEEIKTQSDLSMQLARVFKLNGNNLFYGNLSLFLQVSTTKTCALFCIPLCNSE